MRSFASVGSLVALALGIGFSVSACEGDGTGLMDGGNGGSGGGGACRENCDGAAGSGGQGGDAGGDRGGGGGSNVPTCSSKPPAGSCEKGAACNYCTEAGAAQKCACEAGKWSCGATDSFTCPKPDAGADGAGRIPTCSAKPPTGACEKGAVCGYCTEAGTPQKCVCEGGTWHCGATDSFKCPKI